MIQQLFGRALFFVLLGSALFSNLICMHSNLEILGAGNSESSLFSDGCDLFLDQCYEFSQENIIPSRESLSFEKMEASRVSVINEKNDENGKSIFYQLPFLGTAGPQVFNNICTALNAIRVFNFNAMKRSDNQLETFYMAMLDLLKIEARCGWDAYVYFQDWQTENLIMNWYSTESFYMDQSTRGVLKVNLFDAFEFLEAAILHFHSKIVVFNNGLKPLEQLRDQLKTTKKHIIDRIVARS